MGQRRRIKPPSCSSADSLGVRQDLTNLPGAVDGRDGDVVLRERLGALQTLLVGLHLRTRQTHSIGILPVQSLHRGRPSAPPHPQRLLYRESLSIALFSYMYGLATLL